MTEEPPSSGRAPVRILFFGRVGDLFGREIAVELPEQGCSLSSLRDRVARQRADGEGALAEARAAVDHVITAGETWVRPGQEVAFFSIFSGG